MSDNPFINSPDDSIQAEPTPEQAPKTDPNRKPSWLTFILILTLGLGLLGILGSCLSIASPVVSKAILELTGDQGMSEDQIIARDQLQELADKQYVPNLIFALANLVVAPLLLFGAIGGLRRKPGTPKMLKLGYKLAIGLVILRTIYSYYVQFTTKDQTLEFTMKQAGPQAAAMQPMIEIFYWGVLVIGVIFVLAMLLFYFVSLMKMKSPQVVAYFSS